MTPTKTARPAPTDEAPRIRTEEMVLNMGPQHPSTHGVLQLILHLDGETVVDVEPVVGYLHRGKEKHSEHMTYLQFYSMVNRLDYLASLSNELGWSMAIEKLCGIEVPKRARYLRVIVAELSRTMAHLIYIACCALDLGAGTVFFYGFRGREQVYDLLDSFTGLRMNNEYMRFGGVSADIPDKTRAEILEFCDSLEKTLDDIEHLLTGNRIWHDRNKGIGIVSAPDAIALGLTGPNLRASGVEWDLRKTMPYCDYQDFEFDVPIGKTGDCWDRYLVRMEEMRQSLKIVRQAVGNLPPGEFLAHEAKMILPPKARVFSSMEELIHQFKIVTDFRPPAGEVYVPMEAPKGELGFFVVSRGENKPYRTKIRSPSFVNLQAVRPMCRGVLISDVIAVISSLDFVLGEVDR
ncbi:MAG: NADH dehydrogenase (quinone) subunit D [Planctomycetota bacterium]